MYGGLRKRLIVFLLVTPLTAHAGPFFSDIFVFGDSLSDNGNIFIALGGATTTPTPVSGNTFIPSAPYDRGGAPLLPAFSNGPIWVEQFADALGLTVAPSLLGGNNFAFGGARMAPGAPFPPSVSEQVDGFLTAIDVTPGPDAPSDALYVVWGGGNDARDAAEAVLVSGNPAVAGPFISAYATSLSSAIIDLAAEGAESILVPNVPDIGKVPAVLALGPAASMGASNIATAFNDAAAPLLAGLATALSIELIELDAFGVVNDAVASTFGFGNVSDACAASPACIASPDSHFFWDGIHPTSAGHAVFAEAALTAVPEPTSILLMGLALALLSVVRLSTHVRVMVYPDSL